jgi:hypothetical protein
LVKDFSRKAPLGLKIANELIDAEQKASIRESIDLELAALAVIMATGDALLGLSSVGGKPPQYAGK